MLYMITMRKIYYAIFTISLLVLTVSAPAKADLVSYIDENGEMHYVNTNFSKVPEQYLDQIKQQKEPSETEQKQPSPSPGQSDQGHLADNPEKDLPPPVEVLVNAGCLDCKKLELLLKAHKIPYFAFDVDKTDRGKTLYQQMDGGALPITVIGTRTIYGIDILSITSAYHANRSKNKDDKSKNPKPPEQTVPNNEPISEVEAGTEREEQ